MEVLPGSYSRSMADEPADHTAECVDPDQVCTAATPTPSKRLPVPVWSPLASVPPAQQRVDPKPGLAASRHTHPMRYRDVMQFTCSIVSFYRRSTLGPGMLPIPTASLTMLHERDAIVVVVADERLSAAAPLNIRSQLPLRHLQTRALATRSLSI